MCEDESEDVFALAFTDAVHGFPRLYVSAFMVIESSRYYFFWRHATTPYVTPTSIPP
jgi:hypothetical protein